MFTGVYGPVQAEAKPHFWEELDSIGRCWNLPWLIAGDFNAVRKHAERSSGRATRLEREMFAGLVDEFGLLDFERQGPHFTFSNGQDHPTCSRLDRFLANVQWFESFGDHIEKVRGYFKSDHRLLILQETEATGGPKPFHFEKFWFENKDLLPKIKEWWASDTTKGKPGYVFHKKLKNLRSQLKNWAHQTFGRLEKRI